MSAYEVTVIGPLPEQGQVMVPSSSRATTSWVPSRKARIWLGRWTIMRNTLRAMECMDAPFPGEPTDVTKDERRLLWMDPCSGQHISVVVNEGMQVANKQIISLSYLSIGTGLSIALAVGTGIFIGIYGVSVLGVCLFSTVILDTWYIDGIAHKIIDLSITNWRLEIKAALVQLRGHVKLPVRMEIMSRLLRDDDERLSTGISVSDKVALMRLSKRIDTTCKFSVNRGLVLEGETDELVCRVLDVLDPEWRKIEEQFLTDKPMSL